MSNLNGSYKEFHEQYLSGLQGTTFLDIVSLLVTVVVIGFLASYSRCFVSYNKPVICLVQDSVIFVIPTILLLTVCNSYTLPSLWVSSLAVTSIIVYEAFIRQSRVPVHKILNSKITWKRSPFVTQFKSIISLLTIICILAVDFTVFPLKYAKTESYGYSLMDTGVGFYVFANGLTLKISRSNNAVKKSFISNIPIIFLGLIRLATVETIGYQKHTTEYGVHWNFFFTLAAVKFIGSLLVTEDPGKAALTGLALLFAHQTGLWLGIESWVISDASRTNFLSANREGIASLPGYIGLYILSAALGKVLLFSGTVQTVRDRIYHGLKCISSSIIILAALEILSDLIPSVSRRLANSTFVIWMSALCVLVIGVSIIFEVLIIIIFRRRQTSNREEEKSVFILEAISANNLLFFLVCNLLTGAVNLCVQTLFVPPLHSLLVITSYVIISCFIISVAYVKNWKLKFW